MRKILLAFTLASVALLLGVSSQAQVKPIDLSKLEIVTRINAPGHESGSLFPARATTDSPYSTSDVAQFSPKGQYLVTLDANRIIKYWEVGTAKEIASWQLKHDSFYKPIRMNSENTVTLEKDNDQYLEFDLLTGNAKQITKPVESQNACQKRLKNRSSSQPLAACSGDGKLFAEFELQQSEDFNTINIFEVSTNKKRSSLRVPGEKENGAFALAYSLVFDETAQYIAAVVTAAYSMSFRAYNTYFFNVNTGKTVFEPTKIYRPTLGRENLTQEFYWVPKSLTFLACIRTPKKYAEVQLYLTNLSAKKLQTVDFNNKTQCPSFSDQGQNFLLIRHSSYPELYLTKNQTQLRRFGHSITDFDSTQGGEIITASTAGKMRVWSSINGLEKAKLEGLDTIINEFIISPDSQTMLVKSDGLLKILDVNTKLVRSLELPSSNQLGWNQAYAPEITNMVFSSNSKLICLELTGNDRDKPFYRYTLRLYNTKTAKNILVPSINQNSNLHCTNNSTTLLQVEEVNYRNRLSMIRISDGNVIWTGDWRENVSYWKFSPDGQVFARTLESFRDGNANLTIGLSSINSVTGEGRGWFKVPIGMARETYQLQEIAMNNRILLISVMGGDSCNLWFSKLIFADLLTKTEFKIPKALAMGYEKAYGCGVYGQLPIVKFSKDGKYILVKSGNHIDVWGTRDRQAIFKGQ